MLGLKAAHLRPMLLNFTLNLLIYLTQVAWLTSGRPATSKKSSDFVLFHESLSLIT